MYMYSRGRTRPGTGDQDQTARPSDRTTGYRTDHEQLQQTATAICIAKAVTVTRNQTEGR